MFAYAHRMNQTWEVATSAEQEGTWELYLIIHAESGCVDRALMGRYETSVEAWWALDRAVESIEEKGGLRDEI